MKILITGGLGYIGGRLASFLKENTDAHIYLTKRDKNRSVPGWAKNFNVLQMDILDEKSIGRCLEDVRPDTIIHLAALNQKECLKNPALAVDVNAKGTFRLLNQARQKGVKRFVYFSTFQAYGELAGEVMEKNLTQPRNPYAITKHAGENFVAYFNRCHNMQTLTFRLANAYGYPTDKDVNAWHLVFNSFCTQCMKDGKILIRSNQYRDFITLHDVARAVHHLLFVVPDRWGDGLFNLGGECCLSVSDVARKVADVYKNHYHKEIPVECPPPGQEGIQLKRYNIDKLKNTGFALKGDMEKEIIGIMKLLEAGLK